MKRSIAVILLLCLSVVMYIATIRGKPGNPQASDVRKMEVSGSPFESSHERAPYAQLLSMVNYQRFDLTRELADMGAPDVGYEKGKFFSFFPVGISALILPLYFLGSLIGYAQLFAYSTIAIFAVFNILLIFYISNKVFKLPTWGAILAALLYAFATTSWSYSITIYQHAISTFFLLTCFYSAWKVKEGIGSSFFWSVIVWGSYALSIFIDYPNGLILLPVMAYFALSGVRFESNAEGYRISYKWTIILASFIFIAVMGLHGYYNSRVHGGALKLSNVFARYERDKFDLLLKRINDEENIGLGRDKLKLNKTFQENAMPKGVMTLLVADDKGLFFFSPILLLAILGFISLFKFYKYESWPLFFVFMINLIMYASFGDPWGGWAYGPRYLIPSMSILGIAAAVGIVKYYKYLWLKIVSFVLIVYSAGIALLGAVTTNVVPPKIEAVPEHLPYYNFALNYNFIKGGKSGSFIFNQYLHSYITAAQYYVILLTILIAVFIIVLFVLPKNTQVKKVSLETKLTN